VNTLAGSRKSTRLHVDGVVLLNKPLGISSQQAVSRVRHLFNAAKAGHTGTLDPAADGLLPVCLGEATKFSHLLLDADKTYVATVRLGVVTSTGDAEGEIIASKPPMTDREAVLRVLQQFHGDVVQTPPMHSALKHQGVPLYEYARKGVEIERQPRRIQIHELHLLDMAKEFMTIRVRCSKGTYIRVLAADIGTALGCGASLSALTRTQAGALSLLHPAAATLDALRAMSESERQARLLPVDTLLASLPALNVAAPEAERLLLGQKLGLKESKIDGFARIYGPNKRFLGLVEVGAGGRTVPYRMLAQSQETFDTMSNEILEKTPG
jgi:tRNA pseudouridine55 synthase